LEIVSTLGIIGENGQVRARKAMPLVKKLNKSRSGDPREIT
jgi:hypothetical protein